MAAMEQARQAAFLLLLLVVILIPSSNAAAAPGSLSVATNASTHPPANPSSPRGVNSTQFIQTSCSTTLYPKLCISSLTAYAASLRSNDPTQLALVASNVSLSNIRLVSTRLRAFSRRASASLDPRVLGALKDCAESLADAEDLTNQSQGELAKLQVPGAAAAMGPGVAWCVDNARTWMSAALTDEDTCIDGFTELSTVYKLSAAGRANAGAVRGVMSSVGKLKKYTSNALALVNCLVNDHSR